MTDNLTWLRSGTCSGGSCVEVAKDGADYLIRDSKNPDQEPLRFDEAEWVAFCTGARNGEFRFL